MKNTNIKIVPTEIIYKTKVNTERPYLGKLLKDWQKNLKIKIECRIFSCMKPKWNR